MNLALDFPWVPEGFFFAAKSRSWRGEKNLFLFFASVLTAYHALADSLLRARKKNKPLAPVVEYSILYSDRFHLV